MYKVYQIKNGDTIEMIASKVGASGMEIERLNGLIGDYELIPGEYLVVPNNFLKEGFSSYEIKKGDTIYAIAQKYDADYMQLLKLNGLNKNDYIYPGEEINVPTSGTKFYITDDNDTLENVLKYLGGNPVDVLNNNKIHLKSDQLVYIRNN